MITIVHDYAKYGKFMQNYKKLRKYYANSTTFMQITHNPKLWQNFTNLIMPCKLDNAKSNKKLCKNNKNCTQLKIT